MNVDSLRKLDEELGPVLCRVLLLVRSFFRLFCPKRAWMGKTVVRRILVMKFFGMGTILLASPALQELRRKFPSAEITMFTLRPNSELCGMLDWIDHVVCLDIEQHPGTFFRSFARSLSHIRKEQPDIVINLEFLTHFSALSALLITLFRNKPTVVGFSSPLKWRNAVNDVNVCFDHSRHIMQTFAKVVTSITATPFTLSFEPVRGALRRKMDSAYFDRLLQEIPDLRGCDFFVCISVSASPLSLQRRWPAAYFAEVVNALLKSPRTAVFLIGSQADRAYIGEFICQVNPSQRIIDLSGQTTLAQLLGLFSRCSLLITNDGGPLHFAVAADLATISFFGPETPYLYGPPDDGRHYVFYADRFCSPCLTIYNSKMYCCRDNLCLQIIKPDAVLKVIEERYRSARPGPAAPPLSG